jgi:excisionase family DNA binding protein
MLRPGEAAQLLGVHVNTVSRWSDKGILRAYYIGSRGDKEKNYKKEVNMRRVLMLVGFICLVALATSCAKPTIDLGSRDLVIDEVTITPGTISTEAANLDVTLKASIKERTEEEKQKQQEEERRKEEATEGVGNYKIVITGKVYLTIGPFPVIGSPTFQVPFKRVIMVNIPRLPEAPKTPGVPTPSLPRLP